MINGASSPDCPDGMVLEIPPQICATDVDDLHRLNLMRNDVFRRTVHAGKFLGNTSCKRSSKPYSTNLI